ncbi:hypothetical protein BsWGS_24429 [Bradybaena similaris]
MQDEFSNYQESVKKLSEETKKTGQILDEGAVCQICHKTKFADGIGNSCHFCQKKSCARCGGRMTSKGLPIKDKPNTIWACNLCKKKQDLLAKTGAWYHGGMARPVALEVGDASLCSDSSSSKTAVSPAVEKRSKMSGKQDGSQGSEKENVDRQRSSFSRAGSLQGKELKRQFSMSETVSRGLDLGGVSSVQQTSSSGAISGSGATSDKLVTEQDKLRDHGQIPDRGRGKERGSSKYRFHSESRIPETERRYASESQQQQQQQQQQQHPQERERAQGSSRHEAARESEREKAPVTSHKAGHGDDKKLERSVYRSEQDLRDGRERHRDAQHDRRHEDREQLDRRRDSKDRRKDSRGESVDRYRQSPVNGCRDYPEKDSYREPRERMGEMKQQQQQQQPSVSEGEPEAEVRLDRRSGSSRHHRDRGERTAKDQRRSPSRERDKDKFGGKEAADSHDLQFSRHRILIDHASDNQPEDSRESIVSEPKDRKQHLDPSSAGGRTRNNRKKLESMLRNDSLSSDPSDCVRPPPPKPHKHRRGKKQRQQSLSSSEDEIQSSPECSSCEEVDLESESVSEKGELESITGSQILYHSRLTRAKLEGLHKPTLYDTGRGTSLETESGSSEPQVKDSGNDTGLSSSSNQTLYNMDDILSKHPVTWQTSVDGTKWIGHMILKKAVLKSGGEKRDSSAILGM